MLPNLNIGALLVAALMGAILMIRSGEAVPVGKDHSQFLRKVGAALGDLAAVVLEMNDPYVLERLSSKDQAHKFLVNFLRADSDVPRRGGRFFVDTDTFADSPLRRWSYMSLRNLEAEDQEDAESTSRSADETEVEAAAGAEAAAIREEEPPEGVEVEPYEAEGEESPAEAMLMNDDVSTSSSSSSSSSSSASSEEEEEEEEVPRKSQRIPDKNIAVISAEVPCSEEEEGADDVSLDVHPRPPASRGHRQQRQNLILLLEKVLKDQLWTVVTEATGKLVHELPRRIIMSVEVHAKKIIRDLLGVLKTRYNKYL